MSYDYNDGDGLAALDKTEPAQGDSIAASCAQSIRQIKAYLKDTTASVMGYTKAQVDTLIAGIVSDTVAGKNVFKAKPAVDQDIVHSGGGTLTTDIVLGTEVFDPDNNFAANIFTAPEDGFYFFAAAVQDFLQTGSPTTMTINPSIACSNGDFALLSEADDVDIGQRIQCGSTVFEMEAGQTVKLAITTVVDAAATIRVGGDSYLTGYRIR